MQAPAKGITLDQMLHALAPTAAPELIAHRLVALVREALGIDLCLVMLAQQEHDNALAFGRLAVESSAPDLNGQLLHIPSLDVEPSLWEKLRRPLIAGQLPEWNVQEQDALNPLKEIEYGSLFIIPLAVARQCVGVLLCYSRKVRDLDAQEVLGVQTISSYAAMSIASHSLLLLHTHTTPEAAQPGVSLRALLDDLLADASHPHARETLRARVVALGYDVTKPTAMVVLEAVGTPVPAFHYALRQVKLRLWETYSGSLLDERDHRLYCLVALKNDVTAAGFNAWLATQVQQIESDCDVRLHAGVGGLCTSSEDYARGMAQAEEALQIGSCLHRRAGSACFDELAGYRYLYPFARDHHQRDCYLDHVETIAAYDREHKRAELLDTLETYLALGGNIKEAAAALKVHRNTLTQRLERIQALCGLRLDTYNACFALHLALMIHRLRS